MFLNEGFENVYGLDISTGSIRDSLSQGVRNLLKANVEIGLPYKKDSFDIVICSEVIEHLFNPHIALQEIKRVLKSNGFAIFSFPLELNIQQRLHVLFGKNIHNPLAVGSHIRFFRPSDVDELLNKNGFNIIERRYFCFGSKLDSIPKVGFVLSNYLPNLFAGNVIVKAVKRRDKNHE